MRKPKKYDDFESMSDLLVLTNGKKITKKEQRKIINYYYSAFAKHFIKQMGWEGKKLTVDTICRKSI